MREIKLSPRLSAAAAFVPAGARIADVGTDHGYVPVYLAEKGICRFIAASDINKGPLSSAVRTAKERGFEDRITFLLTDGLAGMEDYDLDTVLIAGMGGETIVSILENAPWTAKDNVTLILQPQTKIPEVSEYLSKINKPVTNAVLARDAGRLYLIIKAAGKGAYGPTEAEKYAPRALIDKRDTLLPEYLDSLISRLGRARAAMAGANIENEKLTEALTGLEAMKEEKAKWHR